MRESDAQVFADAPYYDYCRVNGERMTGKQAQEIMYATVANGVNHDYHQLENEGVGQYDYTVIYEDPTSPSYVVCVEVLDIVVAITAKISFHCSLRYTPVQVCLILLGRMYILW